MISQKIDALPGALDKMTQEFMRISMTRIVERTPILTGVLINNWNPSIGTIDDSENDILGTEDKTIRRVNEFCQNIHSGDVVFFTNPVRYAVYMEEDNGMMRLTQLEREDILREAARNAKL